MSLNPLNPFSLPQEDFKIFILKQRLLRPGNSNWIPPKCHLKIFKKLFHLLDWRRFSKGAVMIQAIVFSYWEHMYTLWWYASSQGSRPPYLSGKNNLVSYLKWWK